MAPDTAAQFALLLSAKPTAGDADPPPGIAQLSAREQELLVFLVARGRTDAQIATELHISIRTGQLASGPHQGQDPLPPAADLTRLALQAGMV
jgi:hypothetical protein